MWVIAHGFVKREHSCFRVTICMFELNDVRGATRLFRARDNFFYSPSPPRDKFELICLHLPAT